MARWAFAAALKIARLSFLSTSSQQLMPAFRKSSIVFLNRQAGTAQAYDAGNTGRSLFRSALSST
jgi:hypothetical protein